MNVLMSWSSGKDNGFSLHTLNQQRPGAVGALLTTLNEAYDRALPASLPPWADPFAENDEFGTCVHAGPMFSQPLVVTIGNQVDRLPFIFRDIALPEAR